MLCKLWSGFVMESEPGAIEEIESQVGCGFVN